MKEKYIFIFYNFRQLGEKMGILRKIALVLFIVSISACTNMKVVKLDKNTGRFPTTAKATVVKNVQTDLDSMKSLLLLPDNHLVNGQTAKSLLFLPSEEFMKGQISNINYFEKTITLDELETQIVKNGLTDKVPSIRDKIGINKAYKAYKPFLWLHFENRTENGKLYGQFILTKPDTLEDIFIVEKNFDYNFEGISDQTIWYPMLNAIVDYIETNSKTWSQSK
jgi:hypothetical protein